MTPAFRDGVGVVRQAASPSLVADPEAFAFGRVLPVK